MQPLVFAGGLIRNRRSRLLAVPLRIQIGRCMTQAKAINGATTHPLINSGNSRASALGTSSPRMMCIALMMVKAITTATVCTATGTSAVAAR